ITPGGEGQRKKHAWIGMVVDRQSAFLPGRGHSRVYLYGHQDFMVSEDAGATWTSLKAAVPGERWVSGLVLAPGRKRPTLFAAVAAGMVGPEKDQQVGGMYRSDDGGQTWTAKNKGLEKGVEWMATQGRKHGAGPGYVYALLVGCAARPATMYLACYQGGIFKTEDAGESWRHTLRPGTDWVHSKEFDGTDTAWRLVKHGGNLEQNDHGTWGPANGLGCSPTDPNAVAYTDNHAIGLTFDGGRRWTQMGSEYGEAYWPNRFGDRPPMDYTHKLRSRGIQTIVAQDAAIDPFDPKTIALAHADIGLRISRDGGEWWEWAYDGIPSLGKTHVAAVLYDPAVQNRLWCSDGKSFSMQRGLGHVYQSDDGGRTFKVIGIPHLEKTSEKGDMALVNALALDPSSEPAARTLYAGTDKGLYKTEDGGTSWQLLSLGMDLPEGLTMSVRKLAVDPTNPKRVYAAILVVDPGKSGKNAVVRSIKEVPKRFGLYRSEDRGASWRQLAAGQIAAVKTLSICKATGTLYVVGDPSVARRSIWNRRVLWRSDDHGDSWRELDDRKLIAFAAVHPADPERVYMATGASDVTKEAVNVWRSRDGGKTWETVADDIPLVPLGGCTQMVFDPSAPHRFLLLHDSGTYEGRDAL
ncbi:MAG: hypothetical protein JXR37_03665, partial [Kiritimatiellae bacterium]|nr:hypothetical protein [Kiritimatiellia bacterium]